MSPKTIIAIILIAVGVVVFTYQGITYTTREKVVDLGPIQMTAEKTKTFPLPPILGAIALVGGIVVWSWGIERGDQRQNVSTVFIVGYRDRGLDD